jgi:hypothetical protein
MYDTGIVNTCFMLIGLVEAIGVVASAMVAAGDL